MQEQLPTSRASAPALPSPRTGRDWARLAPQALAHVAALLAPWTFTPEAAGLGLALLLLSLLGLSAGAHRLMAHRSYRAHPALSALLSLAFVLSAQGSLRRWVRDHRQHHRYADRAGDPHAAQAGLWHAQLGWWWTRADDEEALTRRFADDLELGWLERLEPTRARWASHAALACALFGLGFAWSGPMGGLSMLVWALALRVVLTTHLMGLLNSAAHRWGGRAYVTPDASRNLAWLAVLTLGEGWHNNHHAHPEACNLGFHRWWQLDLVFLGLCGLGFLGLASELQVYRPGDSPTQRWFGPSR